MSGVRAAAGWGAVGGASWERGVEAAGGLPKGGVGVRGFFKKSANCASFVTGAGGRAFARFGLTQYGGLAQPGGSGFQD